MENLKNGVPFICRFSISYRGNRVSGYVSRQFQRENFQYVVFISNLLPFKIEKQVDEKGLTNWKPATTLFKEQAELAQLIGAEIDNQLAKEGEEREDV